MKIKTYIAMMCASLLVAGCSLDFDETNGDTKETAYSYYCLLYTSPSPRD